MSDVILIALIVLVSAFLCGLGWWAGRYAGRKSKSFGYTIVASASIASLLPVAIVVIALIGGMTYTSQSPSDPGDAPAYVFMGALVIFPIVWLLSYVVAQVCAYVGWRFAISEHERGSN